MVFEITKIEQSEKRFTVQVLQITEMLNIYHAELARVLGLRCADIAALANGQLFIQKGTKAWVQGQMYVELYQCLYKSLNADEVQMNHWLRKKHHGLDDSALILMVDKGQLDQVLEYVKNNEFISGMV